MKLLNVGCGASYHKDWVNIDMVSNSENVLELDLREKLPFPDDSFDAVYTSHVLEHFSLQNAKKLLLEIRRLLKPGGVLRVVVPDLEQIARSYLSALDMALAGQNTDNYEWMILELVDQMVREVAGGEMGQFLSSNPKNKDFIFSRIGFEAKYIWEPQTPDIRLKPISKSVILKRKLESLRFKLAKFLLGLIGGQTYQNDFIKGTHRSSGEVHLWMYDRYSLPKLLNDLGFKRAETRDGNTSQIADFESYELDCIASQIRKPDSLFVEATK